MIYDKYTKRTNKINIDIIKHNFEIFALEIIDDIDIKINLLPLKMHHRDNL